MHAPELPTTQDPNTGKRCAKFLGTSITLEITAWCSENQTLRNPTYPDTLTVTGLPITEPISTITDPRQDPSFRTTNMPSCGNQEDKTA